MPGHKKITFQDFIFRVAFGIVGLICIAIALRSGLLLKASSSAVNQIGLIPDPNKLIKMKLPDSGPKVIVLKTGERIECSKVVDPGTGYWGYVRKKDGAISSIKKDDVKEIAELEPTN